MNNENAEEYNGAVKSCVVSEFSVTADDSTEIKVYKI